MWRCSLLDCDPRCCGGSGTGMSGRGAGVSSPPPACLCQQPAQTLSGGRQPHAASVQLPQHILAQSLVALLKGGNLVLQPICASSQTAAVNYHLECRTACSDPAAFLLSCTREPCELMFAVLQGVSSLEICPHPIPAIQAAEVHANGCMPLHIQTWSVHSSTAAVSYCPPAVS